MNIQDLCQAYPVLSLEGDTSHEVSNIVYDSRRARKGSLFVALRGSRSDGHDYLEQVIRQGAVGVVVMDSQLLLHKISVDKKCFQPAIVHVEDSRDALAFLANRFYHEPSKRMKLICTTGVRGRHTLAGMIYQVWREHDQGVAYLNGMTLHTPEGKIYASRNHPETLEYQSQFAELADMGVRTALLPLSSNDIEMKRLAYTELNAMLVMQAKDWETKQWQQLAESSAHLIVNNDDVESELYMAKLRTSQKRRVFISFGIDRPADFRAVNLHIVKQGKRLGTKFTLEIHGQPSYQVFVGLPGRYHVLNSLAVLALTSVSALSLNRTIDCLATISIPGRTEPVANDLGLEIIIDTAWTTGQLENLLTALRPYCKRRLLLVCGSGGDRDTQARIDLGRTAGKLADYTYLTVTNERSEGAASVISDLEQGIKQSTEAYETFNDRAEAVRTAVQVMQKGDILILTGKGAEAYQITAEQTLAYSDKDSVLAALEERSHKEG